MSPAILVASPRHTGSMPVARGSRLPTCPALTRSKSVRTRCRAAFEESPSGLSSSRTPLRTGNLSGASAPGGVLARAWLGGRAARARAIARDRAVDQPRQALGALDGVIEHELQPRGVAQPEAPAELPAQVAGGVGEPELHLLGGIQ